MVKNAILYLYDPSAQICKIKILKKPRIHMQIGKFNQAYFYHTYTFH